MTKRFAAVMLVLVALLAMVGCSQQPAPAQQPAPQAPAQQAQPASSPAPAAQAPAPAPAADKKFQLTLAGASPGGLWTALGEGVNAALDKAFPGSAVTYQTSGGGLANVGLVSSGQVPMGIVHTAEAKLAVNGEAPFTAPVTNIRALAYMYNWSPQQFVFRKDFVERYGITSLADLKEKKIPVKITVNQAGNINEEVNRRVFAAYGFTYEDIDSWGGQVIYAPSGESVNLMRDRRADATGLSLFAPHSAILQIAQAVPVVMIPLDDAVIDRVNSEMGTEAWVVNKGVYDWLEQDVKTVSLGAMLMVNADADPDDIYLITKALVENIDAIRGVHSSMQALTPELMAAQKALPYHDGALRYYKEKGLIQ